VNLDFGHSEYFAGMITMGYLVAGSFFLRFWSRTKDGLFMAFALAFFLLALSSALTQLLGLPREERSWIYLLRAGAFSLLIVAVLQKNFAK
jgi:hypothetical protein